jgi:methionyl-tRNA formyltransferase
MRVVFCGSGQFAIPSLRAIADSGHELVGVLTQPARPRGRGGKLTSTPVGELAARMRLNLIETEAINAPESIETINALSPEVICVVDFGQMIRAAVRKTASVSTFNLHGSLLPHLRGAAPINWALIRGYRTTGVSTFEVADKLDAGAIYLQESLAVGEAETAEQLRRRLADLGGRAVCQTLEMLATGQAAAIGQDESRVTLAPRLTKADGLIQWDREAMDIHNLIRGCWPWPAGRAVYRRDDGRETVVSIALSEVAQAAGRSVPGTVDEEYLVAAGSGRIGILQIKPAGGRLMAWRDFVNGYRVCPGSRFVSLRE